MDWRSWLEGTVVGAIGSLPPAVQRFLGGTPIRIDGQELAPDVQLALRLLTLSGHRGLDTMTPAEARAEIERSALAFAGSVAAVTRSDDLELPGPAGPIRARHYVHREDGPPRALLVYYHGGGWVVGSLESHDPACRFLAVAAEVDVLAIDYRRAPEHRFPAAVDDAVAAFRWASGAAGALGVDRRRIGVAGDSAGGNLAAVVAQLTARDGGPRPALQVLFYPVTDLSQKRRSYRLFADGFFLTEREMDWYRGHYLAAEADARDPRVSPLLADDLAGLPPAIILTAGFDVLRDEGEEYVRRMEAAGVDVHLRRHPGMIHGFCNATGVSYSARAAMTEAAGWIREALGRVPP